MFTRTFLQALIAALAANLAASETTVIYVNAAATGANDGTTWADAFVVLHDALAAAEAGDCGVQIWVAAGEYLPGPADEDPQSSFHLVSGVEMYGGFAGWETQLNQRDWKSNETILRRDVPDWSVMNGAPILVGENLAEGSRLDGFTVRDGFGWGPVGAGGLHLGSSQFAVANCAFLKNHTAHKGGAIAAHLTMLTIDDTDFVDNIASDWGAGIVSHDSALTLVRCKFISNFGIQTGGAIYGASGTSVFLDQCTFKTNKSVFDGAAIWWSGGDVLHIKNSLFDSNTGDGHAVSASLAATLIVEDCAFTNNAGGIRFFGNVKIADTLFENNSSPFDGGGIHTGSAEIDNCVFVGNASTFSGGAIFVGAGAALVRNTTIRVNTATLIGGGGIYSSGSLTLINCDISGNDPVELPGGGVYQAAGDLTMINCRVTDNLGEGVRIGSWQSAANATIINSTLADNGLQIYPRNGAVQLFNAIAWGTNESASCANLCGGAAATCYCDELCCDIGDCCFDKYLQCGGCEPQLGTIEVSHSIVQGLPPHDTGDDPLFVDPANGDYRLQAGSPAIDAGDNEYVPDDITTDLDGSPRIAPGSEGAKPIVDLGAYEFQPSAPSIPGDINGDGTVGVADLLILLTSWGPCANCDSPEDCPADFDGDCSVGVSDLLILLANWE